MYPHGDTLPQNNPSPRKPLKRLVLVQISMHFTASSWKHDVRIPQRGFGCVAARAAAAAARTTLQAALGGVVGELKAFVFESGEAAFGAANAPRWSEAMV